MKAHCSKPTAQRGSTLLEAMIGTLLMAILLVGMAQALNRTLTSLGHLNAHNDAFVAIREKMHTNGMEALCAGGSDTINVRQHNVNITPQNCSAGTVDIAINGVTRTLDPVPAISASVSTAANSDLFGGNGVITFSY